MQNGRRDTFVIRMKVRDEHGNVVGETEAINFKGLLAIAHDEGLKSVRTELVQVPNEENYRTAVVRATVRTRKGVFTGIGDASPANVNRRIAPHVIRMAETRAVARAFRMAVNVGAVAVEELLDDVVDEPKNDNSIAQVAAPRPEPVKARGRDAQPLVAEPGDRRAMSDEQKKYLFRLAYQLGETREGAAQRVLSALGVERFEVATRVAAARAIDSMKAELAKAKPYLCLVILLAVDAGLRAGEVRGVRWLDVDLARGTLCVRETVYFGERDTPKSGHEREIPLTPRLKAALTEAAKTPHLPTDPLAPNSLGRVWGESSLAHAVKGLLSKLEKESHKFHALRHYFVTSLFKAGVGAPTVRDLAGHRHMQVTARYAHSDEGARVAAIAALGKRAS